MVATQARINQFHWAYYIIWFYLIFQQTMLMRQSTNYSNLFMLIKGIKRKRRHTFISMLLLFFDWAIVITESNIRPLTTKLMRRFFSLALHSISDLRFWYGSEMKYLENKYRRILWYGRGMPHSFAQSDGTFFHTFAVCHIRLPSLSAWIIWTPKINPQNGMSFVLVVIQRMRRRKSCQIVISSDLFIRISFGWSTNRIFPRILKIRCNYVIYYAVNKTLW